MRMIHIKDEEELWDECAFAGPLFRFVESVSGENRWFFKECAVNDAGIAWADFTSYVTPEYRNFFLSIKIEADGNDYKFTIGKKVAELA